MTWEELVEKAKELGYKITTRIPYSEPEECLLNEEGFAFYKDGTCEYDCEDDIFCGCPFVYGRTPEQMLMIMEALK